MDWKWSCQRSQWSPSSTQPACFFTGQGSGRKRIFQPTVPRECYNHGKAGCSQSMGRGNGSLLFLTVCPSMRKCSTTPVGKKILFFFKLTFGIECLKKNLLFAFSLKYIYIYVSKELILNLWKLAFLNNVLFIYYFNWRLITLQFCDGFSHTLTWISLKTSILKKSSSYYRKIKWGKPTNNKKPEEIVPRTFYLIKFQETCCHSLIRL